MPVFLLISLLSLFLYKSAHAPQPTGGNWPQGREIFVAKCQGCHAFQKKVNGPPLMGVTQRWQGNYTELADYIRHSKSYTKSARPFAAYARELDAKYPKAHMPAYTQLTTIEMDDLVAYLHVADSALAAKSLTPVAAPDTSRSSNPVR